VPSVVKYKVLLLEANQAVSKDQSLLRRMIIMRVFAFAAILLAVSKAVLAVSVDKVRSSWLGNLSATKRPPGRRVLPLQ